MKNKLHQGQMTAAVRSPQLKLMAALIAGCMMQMTAYANPQGGVVTHGNANFDTQGNVLTIVNTPGTVIDWQNFSINANEITRFLQQNSSSAVLNRVVGQDPTQILGALQSNGKVFLINPNGILFGHGAQIDTNGLVASTLNISNEDFLAGRKNFAGGVNAGTVENQGTITTPSGGQVYLIASSVTNNGIITSPQGEVVLAAGHSVQLADSSNPDLHVVVSAPQNQALNLGQIVAHSGKVGIFGALIDQRGTVNADSAVIGTNGKIVFKASGDTVLGDGSRTSATGVGSGGEIEVLGNRVGVVGDALIDASGKNGGGTVLVGGDYQGKNPKIINAQQTVFGKNAIIKADAIDTGNGGKVIVWADDATRAYGSIWARGGDTFGNGGLVETSGKQHLDFNATVDTGAKNGHVGSVLLDPATLVIRDSSNEANDNDLGDGSIFATDSPTSDYAVSWQQIYSILNSANVTLQATGDVTFEAALSQSIGSYGGKSMMIQSMTGDIRALTSNADLQSGGANVILKAGRDIVINGISSQNGTVSLTAARNIDISGNIDTNYDGILSDVSLIATGGTVIVRPAAQVIADALHIEAVGGISDGASGGISTGINSFSATNNGGDIRLTNEESDLAINGSGVQQTGSGDVTIVNTGSMLSVAAPITTTGGKVVLVANDMNITANINVGNGAVILSSYAPSGMTVLGTGSPTFGTLELDESELKKIYAADSLSIYSPFISIESALDLSGAHFGRLILSADGGSRQMGGGVGFPPGSPGPIFVNQAVNMGSHAIEFEADALILNALVTAPEADIRAYTLGLGISVGIPGCSLGPCLGVSNLYNLAAGTIGIGSSDASRAAGPIDVIGITVGGTGVTDRNAATTRIGLLSGGTVSQTGAINVQDLGIEANGAVTLNAANQVTNFAANISGGNLSFTNAGSFTTSSFSGQDGSASSGGQGAYTLTGVSAAGHDINLQASSGNILVSSAISGGAGSVSLSAQSGKITGSGVSGASLTTSTRDGVTLVTQVAALDAFNSGASGDINITNTGPLAIQGLTQGASGGTGGLIVDNTGALTVPGSVSTFNGSGKIALTAHSPLTVDGDILSSAGDITLEAGASGSTGDKLTINGQVTAGSGNIVLRAGDEIIGDATSTGGTVTKFSNLNTPPVVVPPDMPPAETPPPDVIAAEALPPVLSLLMDSLPPYLQAATVGESDDDQDSDKKDSANGGTKQNSGAEENDASKKMYCN